MTDWHHFIWEHREDNPSLIALSAKKFPGMPVALVARQVEALSKIRRKIPSWYREGLDFPIPVSLEQASSEATALFKSSLFSGKKMADLTGGLGVDAFFFARQFDQISFVEKMPEILTAAVHNLGVLGIHNIVFKQAHSEQFLQESDQTFDLIYVDPARRDEWKGKVFQLDDCSPNVLEMNNLLLQHAPKILIKTAPLLDIHLAMQQLKNVSKVWVVAYEGDCREVLYLCEKTAPATEEVPIVAVSLNKSGVPEHSFEFTFQEEQSIETTFSTPGGFLYEPMPALYKAGAFKSFAKRYGLFKLHPNTHLYTSDELIQQLPARTFKIDAVCKYDKKAVQALVPAGKANISTRNFPDNTEQVRKKLGLQDGSNTYVFAATDIAEKKRILVCSKI